MVKTSNESSRQIVRSSAVVASASLVTIFAGMVRVKAFALLLGPAGVGAFGIYSAFIDVAASACGLGIASSGVRQIAEASGNGDQQRIADTAALVRYLSIALGAIAALALLICADPLAHLTFGNAAEAGTIALLGLAVMLRIIGAGEASILQGRRQIGALAKASIAAAVVSTIASILLALALGMHSVIPALLVVTASGALANFVYSRKLATPARRPDPAAMRRDAFDLVTLGFAFMISGILSLGAAYLVRIIVLHNGGIEAAGLYQAAWTLGGLYVGILLQAMGTDFYPRVTAIHRDPVASSELINEQIRISVILGGPGIAATIAFAPLAMVLFYSSEFVDASQTLRWICVGMALRIVSWPLGYVLLAHGMKRSFVLIDILAYAIQVALAQWLVTSLGLVGAGLAFFAVYLLHTPLVYLIVRTACGIRISGPNLILCAGYMLITLSLALAFVWLDPMLAAGIGGLVVLVTGAFAARDLLRLFAQPGAVGHAPDGGDL